MTDIIMRSIFGSQLYGTSTPTSDTEFMTVYMRLKKIGCNYNLTIFNHPDYGKGTQKPDASYFEQIEKWPYVNGSIEKFKRED